MREILFRGKQVNNDEWVIGNLICLDVPKDIISDEEFDCYIGDSRGIYSFRVNPSTLGQYTGLTDKNGNKIFEGDILKAKVSDRNTFGKKKEAYWTVEYKERFTQGNTFYVYGVNRRWSRTITQSMIRNCDCEIIGNIHDNLELIKQEG